MTSNFNINGEQGGAVLYRLVLQKDPFWREMTPCIIHFFKQRESKMSIVLSILGWTLLGLAVTVGLALNLVGLFGNWVILSALAITWAATGLEHFGVWVMVLFLLLAILGEVIEMFAAGYGASKFGGGRGAALSSLIGCIAGAILGSPWFPLIGTLAGAILGAFAGAVLFELLVEKKMASDAVRTGVGAALGRTGAVLAKVVIGLVMLAIAVWTY